jgi:hypothetical protein
MYFHLVVVVLLYFVFFLVCWSLLKLALSFIVVDPMSLLFHESDVLETFSGGMWY